MDAPNGEAIRLLCGKDAFGKVEMQLNLRREPCRERSRWLWLPFEEENDGQDRERRSLSGSKNRREQVKRGSSEAISCADAPKTG